MPNYRVRDNQTGEEILIPWDNTAPIKDYDIERAFEQQRRQAQGAWPPGVPRVNVSGQHQPAPPAVPPIPRNPVNERIIDPQIQGPTGLAAKLPTDPTIPESIVGMLRDARESRPYKLASTPFQEMAGGNPSDLSRLDPSGQPSFGARMITEGMPGIGPVLAGLGAIKPQWQANAAEMMSRQATPAAVLSEATLAGGVPGLIGNAALGAQGALQATDPQESGFGRAAGGLNALLSLIGLTGLHSGAAPGEAPKPGVTATSGVPLEGVPPVPPPGPVAAVPRQEFSSTQFSSPTPAPRPAAPTPAAIMAQEKHGVAMAAAPLKMEQLKVSLATAEQRLRDIQGKAARTAQEIAAKAEAEKLAYDEVQAIKAELVPKASTVVETYKAPNEKGGTEVGTRRFGPAGEEDAGGGGGGGGSDAGGGGGAAPNPHGLDMLPSGQPRTFYGKAPDAIAQAKRFVASGQPAQVEQGPNGVGFKIVLETPPAAAPAAPPAASPIVGGPSTPPPPVVPPGGAGAAGVAPVEPLPPPGIDPIDLTPIVKPDPNDPRALAALAAPAPGSTPPVFEPTLAPEPIPPSINTTPAAPTPPEQPVKRGRGRPPGAKNKPKPPQPEGPQTFAPGTPTEPVPPPGAPPTSTGDLRKARADWIRERFPDDPAARAEAYKALGGIDSAIRSAGGDPGKIDITEALARLKELFGGGGGGDDTGAAGIGTALNIARYGAGMAGGAAMDPQHPIRGAVVGGVLAHSAYPIARTAAQFPVPAARAALGAGIGGYLANDQGYDPLLGGVVGGVLGAAVPYNAQSREFMKALDSSRYEGMLSGAAQATNIAGNVGSLVASPVLDLIRGDTAGAMQMLRQYMHPIQTAKTGFQGGLAGWREMNPSLKFGSTAPTVIGGHVFEAAPIRPMGPAGRMLHAVDAGTKAILQKGGKTAEQAATLTYSGDPVTKTGAMLAGLQSTPLARLVTPFARTAINQAELGAALSPARYFSPELRSLVPSTGTGAAGKLQEAALMSLAPAAGYAGFRGLASSNQSKNALAGPVTTPVAAGEAVYDYGRYGRTGGRDAGQAILNQVPFLSDIPRLAENPSKIGQGIIAQPIPQALLMLGDKTVREPSSPADSIRERIPALRESLPVRSDFSGQPLQRNLFGQYPPPQYETDAFASRLADLGLLRREQSPSQGGDTLSGQEASRLQQLRGQNMRQVLEPPLMSGAFDAIPKTAAIDQALAQMAPEQATAVKKVLAIMQRQNPQERRPQTQLDVIKLLERYGIKLGSDASDRERLAAAAGDLGR